MGLSLRTRTVFTQPLAEMARSENKPRAIDIGIDRPRPARKDFDQGEK